MGRPLKIQKYNLNAGQASSGVGANVAVDQGYPNFGSLTNPTYPTVSALNSDQFLGVVGGVSSTATSTTYPIVRTRVNITSSYTGEDDGVILRQKGAHKYLVATVTAIDPANAVVGVALRIASVGDTNWTAMGAPGNYAVGTVFTPVAAAGAGTSGTANEVGVCVLDDDATPAAGFMSIAWMQNDSTELYLSKLTNKFMLDWTGGSNYSPTSVVNDVRYIANFFSDEGTEVKSGTTGANNTATQQNNVNLAIIQNYTS
jgi:hypothetical protein